MSHAVFCTSIGTNISWLPMWISTELEGGNAMPFFDDGSTVRHGKLPEMAWVKHFEQAALDHDTDFINLTFFISVLKIRCLKGSAKRVEVKDIISLSGYSKSTFFRRYRTQRKFWSEMRALANNLLIDYLKENFTNQHEANDQTISELLICIQGVNNEILTFLAEQGDEPIEMKVSNAYQLCLHIEEAFKDVTRKNFASWDVDISRLCKLLHVAMVDALVISHFYTSAPQKKPIVRSEADLVSSYSKFSLVLN